MAKKIFKYKGKTIEELQGMNLNEVIALLPAKARRSLNRGFTEEEKKVYDQVQDGKDNIRTHCRGLIILPSMVNKTFQIHSGKSFDKVQIIPEMVGHRLGEFVFTRRRLKHSSPGVGATKSSSAVSVK